MLQLNALKYFTVFRTPQHFYTKMYNTFHNLWKTGVKSPGLKETQQMD